MSPPPTLLMTLRGVVAAPIDAVASLILDAGPGGRSPIIPAGRIATTGGGGDDQYTVTVEQAGSRVTIEIDRNARTASIRGEWWYRADISLAPHEEGCLVTQQIFNIAERQRWAAGFVARKPLRASPDAFAGLLQTVGKALGCRAYPLR